VILASVLYTEAISQIVLSMLFDSSEETHIEVDKADQIGNSSLAHACMVGKSDVA